MAHVHKPVARKLELDLLEAEMEDKELKNAKVLTKECSTNNEKLVTIANNQCSSVREASSYDQDIDVRIISKQFKCLDLTKVLCMEEENIENDSYEYRYSHTSKRGVKRKKC